jgi:hypothetical protein
MTFLKIFRVNLARTFCGALAVALLGSVSPMHAQSADDAHRIFDLTNQDRQEHGLPVLRWDASLAHAARAHADRMAQERALSHRYSDEPELTERGASAGAHFRAIAENIATGPNPEGIENEWMHSPPHRANILDPKMDALGVAVVERDGKLYAVEDFEQSSQALTKEQVEGKVRELLQARGVDPSADAGPAEQACASGHGVPQGTNARSIVRFDTPDLGQLPAQVVEVIASRDFKKAAVGACAPNSGQANFTTYRVAILFY